MPPSLPVSKPGIARFEQIVETSHVSGAFDYLLKVVVPDMAEWHAIAQDVTASDIGGKASTRMC